MPLPAAAAAAAVAVGQSILADRANDKAADAQTASANESIRLQADMFNKMQELLKPYVEAGNTTIPQLQNVGVLASEALPQLKAFSGLGGAEAEQQAIDALSKSPLFLENAKQAEDALLQNAAATGNLRGGNLQAALMQLRPKMLQDAINQRYGQLGGLFETGLNTTQGLYGGGQASAAGVGQGGMNYANSITALNKQKGQIASDEIVGRYQNFGDLLSSGAEIGGFKRGFS